MSDVDFLMRAGIAAKAAWPALSLDCLEIVFVPSETHHYYLPLGSQEKEQIYLNKFATVDKSIRLGYSAVKNVLIVAGVEPEAP